MFLLLSNVAATGEAEAVGDALLFFLLCLFGIFHLVSFRVTALAQTAKLRRLEKPARRTAPRFCR